PSGPFLPPPGPPARARPNPNARSPPGALGAENARPAPRRAFAQTVGQSGPKGLHGNEAAVAWSMLVLAGARRSVHQEEQLARNSHSHSASKRSREADRAKQKQDKQERLRRNRESGVGGIPIASVDEIQVAAMATPMPDLESAEAAPEPRSSSVGGPPCRLFVGSLSRETTSQDLR